MVYRRYQTQVYSDPSVSNSGAYFIIRPPIGNTLIDRNILLELTVNDMVIQLAKEENDFNFKCF